ncbi:retinol dehydrogenase 11-like [Planococcus citri]|uniref:retinol dehydrogenase 11-like n=1 Tax=Planococcus citri TaxID=170843 RepID=UPI0031F76101
MISGFLCVILPIVVTLGILRKYRESKWGKFESQDSLKGKVFIITGANSGIGKETTRCLVQRNAKVIMACRDIKSAKKAIADIRTTTANGEMIPLYLDLQSLDSIKTFANIILQDFPKIHVLINNAGISIPCRQSSITDDGFEIHFQVNYLGHFILTKLLLARLQESAPSRIVILSSTLHERGSIDFENLNGENGFDLKTRFNPPYCNSKLMDTYFAYELRNKLQNSGVSVYAVCPGWCKTGLMRHSRLTWYKWPIFLMVAIFFMRSSYQGCQTVVYCATSEELELQKEDWFYRDCQKYKSKHDFNAQISDKLWQVSEQLIANTKKF